MTTACNTREDVVIAAFTEYDPLMTTKAGMFTVVNKFLRDERGQDLIEYTLLLAFVALASAALFMSAGGSVSTIWGAASGNLANAATGAS